MTDDGFELIGTIPRNETDVVKVRKGNYYKIDVIDIRWLREIRFPAKAFALIEKRLRIFSTFSGES